MRILFVSQEFPPETGWGGIGTYVDVLSDALAAKGHEVHVLSIVDGQPSRTTRVGDVIVHRRTLRRLRGRHRVPPELADRVWLAWHVQRISSTLGVGFDVIECPEWKAEGLALSLRGAIPLVIRLHSSARQLFPFTGQGREWRGLDAVGAAAAEEIAVRRANVVVSTRSNLDEVSVGLRLDEAAVHAIPYPVRLPSASPMPEPELAPRIVFVGRLEPRKGPDVLLRAAPAVLAERPDARFVFIGRDAVAPDARPSTGWLRAEAQRLGVAHAVELTGQLERAAVDEQLRRATVCAFPSRWESFGNVVAEASAIGRPVVVSSIPPFQELVEDEVTGRIVPATDERRWGHALIDVLADHDRAREMGSAGAVRVAGIAEPGRVADLAQRAHEHAITRWGHGQHAARPRFRRSA